MCSFDSSERLGALFSDAETMLPVPMTNGRQKGEEGTRRQRSNRFRTGGGESGIQREKGCGREMMRRESRRREREKKCYKCVYVCVYASMYRSNVPLIRRFALSVLIPSLAGSFRGGFHVFLRRRPAPRLLCSSHSSFRIFCLLLPFVVSICALI